MKKFLLVLALVGCVFGMTACGSEEKAEAFPVSIEDITSTTEGLFDDLNGAVAQGVEDTLASQLDSTYGGDVGELFLSACDIWVSTKEEIGSYNGVVSGSVRVEGDINEFTIFCEIDGSTRNADVELYYTKDRLVIPEMMISPQYTLGEKMEKAALNTLLGMGTVFIVLILIMLIIMAFGIIPKIEKSIADKKAKKNVSTEKAVDNTIAQIVEKEELSDDTELVAVIAAAIAASEGAATTDGFVVRSIKRANTNKWQRA
ncbi:MAG: OadG family protein [Lachnospiraceae bacterium]|nr:OadG family protein [Lachnospiraceae bacterium]